MTAFHNVESFRNITAIDHNMKEYNASIVNISIEDDLAILQIDAKSIPFAKTASSESKLGSDAYILTAEHLLLKGIASKVEEGGIILNVEIPKGSSGGGVFNSSNELIAIALRRDYLDKTSFGVGVSQFTKVTKDYYPKARLKRLESNNYDYSHCEDERDLAIWKKYAKSNQLEIQEFHAIFVGLCVKVKNRDLTTEEAQLIFEKSRARLFGK